MPAKKTTWALNQILDRRLDDAKRTNWSLEERMDAMTDAQNFIQTQLMALNLESLEGVYFNRRILDKDNFSYKNKITLPDEWSLSFELREEGAEDPLHIHPRKRVDDDVEEDRSVVFSSPVTAPLPNSANSGTDELDNWGEYTGTATQAYTVTIAAGGATFNWTGASSGTGVAITGDWQTLENGIQIKFASTSGYTAGDEWTFTAYHDRERLILQLNFDPENNIFGVCAKFLDDITTVDQTTYLPFTPLFYSAYQTYCVRLLRARDEEDVRLEDYVYAPTMKKIREASRFLNADEDKKNQPSTTYNDYV